MGGLGTGPAGAGEVAAVKVPVADQLGAGGLVLQTPVSVGYRWLDRRTGVARGSGRSRPDEWRCRTACDDGPAAVLALRRDLRRGDRAHRMINTWHMLEGRLDLARSYDRVLFAKVALFTMMVTVAALNRYRLVPRLTRSDPALVFRALSFTIVIELFIGAVVLLAVSALGLMSPY